jgi:hypothetical protein
MDLLSSLLEWEKSYRVHQVNLPHIFLHLENEEFKNKIEESLN